MSYEEAKFGPAVAVRFQRTGLEIVLDPDRPPVRMPDRKLPRRFVPEGQNAASQEPARDSQLRQKNFYYEILDSNGMVVFSATASDPTGVTVEVPAEGRAQGLALQRQDNVGSTTSFTLIVPDYPPNSRIRMFSAQIDRAMTEKKGSQEPNGDQQNEKSVATPIPQAFVSQVDLPVAK